MHWKTTKRAVLATVAFFALLLGVWIPGRAEQADTITLRFDDEMAAMINARRWEETEQQWLGEKDEMFFDGVHRFLLLRFPGCAEAIHQKVREGFQVELARLLLHWQKQEFVRVEGYKWRPRFLRDKQQPTWHAQAWLLRCPWTDDAGIGPTWNAYINGAGYWRNGGAHCTYHDRFPQPLGDVPLSSGQPEGVIDVTAALASAKFGITLEARLRTLEDCGFLLDKADPARMYRNTAIARMWVERPELVVTLRRVGETAKVGELPPPVDVHALARELRAAGGDGVPTSSVPDNLEELCRPYREQTPGMPDWMWKRVQEVRAFRSPSYTWLNDVYDGLESGEREKFLAALDILLSVPPGFDVGHLNMDMLMPVVEYGTLLPEVVRYHIREYFAADWTPPYDGPGWAHRFGGRGEMGTLNLETNFRACAVMVGELLGLPDLVLTGRRGVSMLNRQRIYHEGVIEERGDSYYLGITMAQLKALSRYSGDPLTRLKASLAIEKVLFEINSTYHPGLRRRVAPISRRQSYTSVGAPLSALILAQDVPRAVLHTLSRKGVLIETDKPAVHGVPVMGMGSTIPARVARLAPWGEEWEANAVDEKPLPFLSVSTDYVRGGILKNPIYNVTYMGRSYALASANSEMGFQWPVLAAWRRSPKAVERLEELGLMFPWGYANGKLMIRVHPQVGQEGSVVVGLHVNPLVAVLQHRNKMIHVMRSPERAFLADMVKEGLRSLSSRMLVFAWGSPEAQELWVNDARVDSYPASLKHGDVITIYEGESYVGLIPLPATDLGRTQQVAVRFEHPLLYLDSYLLDAEEPLGDTEQTWQALANATAGWIIELGDAHEYGSFDAFRQHMEEAQLTVRWEAPTRTLHVAYRSGRDALEIGVNTTYQRASSATQRPVTESWAPVPPARLLAYQRVNGRWPWPDRGIDLDCPLGRMGKAALLRKGGAVLKTLEGQMAMLRIEPISGTYEGVNPFIDPQPFELRTPEGVVVRSEGPIGCSRITVRPRENKLWVDYHLPPPQGDCAVEQLQEEGSRGARTGYVGEYALSRYFRPGVDVKEARAQSARALLVMGLDNPPKVILNGKPLEGPFAKFNAGEKTWFRIPIVAGQ